MDRLSFLYTVFVLFPFLVPAESTSGARPPLSAWYRFEQPDALGRSTGQAPWPGTPHGVASVKGRYGRGLSLPGNRGNGLYLPKPTSFFGPIAFAGTIALWVQPAADRPPGPRVIIDFMASTGNSKVDGHEVVILIDGDKLKAWPCLSGYMTVPNPLREGRWTHLAMAWDCARGVSLYVDGARVAERKGPLARPTKLQDDWPGRVGCHTATSGYAFAGVIDELRIFNTQLEKADIERIRDLNPQLPQLRLKGNPFGRSEIVNAGSAPARIEVEIWLPGKNTPPQFRGFLPCSFTERYWTAGATSPEAAFPQIALAPASSTEIVIPFDRGYLGPARVRFMTGTGLARQELPISSAAPSSLLGRFFGKPVRTDRRGLGVVMPRSSPAVFFAGEPLTVPLRISNDLGYRFAGTIRMQLLGGEGEERAQAVLPVRLRPGRTRIMDTPLDYSPSPGKYTLRVFAESAEREYLVQEVPVYATKNENSRTLCGVGAAYTTPPDDRRTLEAMARDGVAVLRLGGKRDGHSFRENLSTILEHGFKVWRTPAFSYRSVCADEKKIEQMRRGAADLGAGLRDNLAVINQSMAGEGLGYPPCYCRACARAFRSWLRDRHGDLETLNSRWGSAYSSWDEIAQLGSPRDVDDAAERLKMMRLDLKLPENNTKRWQRLFELDRPRAMEWKRWHDRILVRWYREFAAAFRKTNGGTTPIGEQPCWPNFKTHILFELGGIADTGGMDLYLPGELGTTLGYPAELFLNFDLNASVFHAYDKPVMLHEMYVQDNSPAGLAEAQGWWLIGRGYNLITYFTYNYYHEGKRNGKPLIFGMFDKAEEPYPCYPSFVRFSRRLKAFHAEFDVHSMRREEPRVGLFLGDDVSLANALESGGATWNALGVLGHNGAYWLTERNGFPMEFVNERSFERLDGKSVLVVPWCHVAGRKAVSGVLEFAAKGGTVLVDGPFAQYDEAYVPYPRLPGGGIAPALGLSYEGYADEPNAIVGPNGVEIPSRGVASGLKLSRGSVLFRDPAGRPAVVEVSQGKGRVILLLTSLGRRHRSRVPDPEAVSLWGFLLRRAGLRPRLRLRSATSGAEADGPAGKALFDVSVRIRNNRELFLFLVSFYGPTRGRLRVDLPPGRYTVEDAVVGDPVELLEGPEGRSLAVDVPSFGTRVIRLSAREGTPFADW